MDGSKEKCPVCGNRRMWGAPFFMGRRKYFICGTIEDEKVCKLVAERQKAYEVKRG